MKILLSHQKSGLETPTIEWIKPIEKSVFDFAYKVGISERGGLLVVMSENAMLKNTTADILITHDLESVAGFIANVNIHESVYIQEFAKNDYEDALGYVNEVLSEEIDYRSRLN